jgi:hypothetical protein
MRSVVSNKRLQFTSFQAADLQHRVPPAFVSSTLPPSYTPPLSTCNLSTLSSTTPPDLSQLCRHMYHLAYIPLVNFPLPSSPLHARRFSSIVVPPGHCLPPMPCLRSVFATVHCRFRLPFASCVIYLHRCHLPVPLPSPPALSPSPSSIVYGCRLPESPSGAGGCLLDSGLRFVARRVFGLGDFRAECKPSDAWVK